jgi:hypothetical protein
MLADDVLGTFARVAILREERRKVPPQPADKPPQPPI